MSPCKACSFELSQNLKFCPQCGSKVIKDRLTIRRMASDLFKIVTNLEGPFIKTTSSLFSTPRNVTIDFISGKRKVINSPIRYGIIAVTVYGFFQFLFQDFFNDLEGNNGLINAIEGVIQGTKEGAFGYTDSPKMDNVDTTKAEGLKTFLQKHSQFTNFLIVPIFALVSSKVYELSKYNYAEHFSIFLYAVSLSLLLTSTLGILFGFFDSEHTRSAYYNIVFILNFLVVTWIAYKSYEENYSYAVGVFLLSYFFYFFLVFVGFALLSVI